MLNRRRVLVVEDDFIVAADLVAAIVDAEGEPIGPAASIAEAMALLDHHTIDAAIIDVQLEDGDITPVAVRLLGEGRVVVFHTASDVPAPILVRFGPVSLCVKPMASALVVRRLSALK